MSPGNNQALAKNSRTASANRWTYPALDSIVFAGAGLAMLFIGSWIPNPRLNVNGVPIDSLAIIVVILLATLGSVRRDVLRVLALLQLPLLLLAITIAWSPYPEIGIDNLTSLILTSFLAFILFNTVIERQGEIELARVLLLFLSLNLLAALAYKAVFGFFDRNVLFFLNGPIVFGRFMSIALILSLFVFRGWLRIVAAAVFFMAIVWTGSKGPVIAALLTIMVMVWFSPGYRGKVALVSAVALITFSLIAVANYYQVSAKELGRLAVLLNVLSGDTTLSMFIAGESGRTSAWGQTVDLIFAQPFGVGLGGWTRYVRTASNLPYAHNLFLELWSEGGVILGTLACIPLLVFFAARKSMFWYTAVLLFIAQLVSGNISDARQMYVFGLLAALSGGLKHSGVAASGVVTQRVAA